MVSFKKLFFATSVLLSRVAAAPIPGDTLDVAAAEVRAVNDFTIESRDFVIESRDSDAVDATKPKPKTQPNPKPKPTANPTTTVKPRPVTTAKPRSVTTAEARGVNDFAIESRDFVIESRDSDAVDATKPTTTPAPTNCISTRNTLERRVLTSGSNANSITETQWVSAQKIKENGGKAIVTDLTGCSALFFFKGNELNFAVHILCGSEVADAENAVELASGSDSVVIWASSDKYLKDAVTGIKNYDPDFDLDTDIAKAKQHIYEYKSLLGAGKARTIQATSGSFDVIQGSAPRICTQPQQ